jgi:hypothetical protein
MTAAATMRIAILTVAISSVPFMQETTPGKSRCAAILMAFVLKLLFGRPRIRQSPGLSGRRISTSSS